MYLHIMDRILKIAFGHENLLIVVKFPSVTVILDHSLKNKMFVRHIVVGFFVGDGTDDGDHRLDDQARARALPGP